MSGPLPGHCAKDHVPAQDEDLNSAFSELQDLIQTERGSSTDEEFYAGLRSSLNVPRVWAALDMSEI
ncbi:hypothetical protein SLA2020_345620 [Shorea laevis]